MLALFSTTKPTSSENDPLHKTPGTTPTGNFSHMSGGVVKPLSLFVAGMDITSWPIVEITAPAGPLGILLDGSCSDAALLDDFAPVTRQGAPGAVEASGVVPHGSVLIGMDRFDFMQQPRKTLSEIGVILREASHLKRQLRFKVPPESYHKLATPRYEDDKSKLMIGPTSSSTNLMESSEGTKTGGEWSSILWSGLRAATTLAASIPRVTSAEVTPPAQPTPELTASRVPQTLKTTGRPASFVRVTGMEDRPLEADKHPYVPSATDQVVSIEVPPGSLGLNLDGHFATRAVVVGFVPLPDGSRGMLEQSGSVSSGAEIVEINGEDVSQESLAGIRERLGRMSGEPRRLSFRLPPPVKVTVQVISAAVSAPAASSPTARRISAVAMQRMSLIQASLPTYTEDLELRRRLELKLIMNYDRKELKFKECWFVVHTEWMNRWVLFVAKGEPEPGPLTNDQLLLPGWTSGHDPNRAAFVRPGLEIMKDFRFVSPMVWSLLTALHSPGDAPPIARYTLDINSEAPDNIDEILHDSQVQATGLATSLREKCQVQVN